jgi:hypothetical protein
VLQESITCIEIANSFNPDPGSMPQGQRLTLQKI